MAADGGCLFFFFSLLSSCGRAEIRRRPRGSVICGGRARFVIPAKAGIQLCFWSSALTRKPTHVRVSFVRHPGGRVTSLACPKRSNQRERHPRGRGRRASMPGDYARALRRFADSTSVYRQRTRAHPARAPSGFFLRALAAAERDPGARAERGSPCRRSKAAACFALALGSLCDAAKGGRTRPAHRAGAREGSRAFRCRAGCPVSGTPAARSAPARSAGAAPRVCSLWLLSLAQARESDSAARMAGRSSQGRESVLA